jgi:hypothetical protein
VRDDALKLADRPIAVAGLSVGILTEVTAGMEVLAFMMGSPAQTNSSVAYEEFLKDVKSSGEPHAFPRGLVTIAKAIGDRFLTDLATHGRCLVPFTIEETRWSPGTRATRIAGGNIRSRFAAAVFALFEELGDRLVLCARGDCRRFFVRGGKGARKYCSTRCSQYVRSTTFRKKHPERVKAWRRRAYDPERRHRAYDKERRRVLGPNVKTTRRSRRLTGRAAQAEV